MASDSVRHNQLDHENNRPMGDAPVLVVVLNNPVDLIRAAEQGWYRIPMTRAPDRLAAEYLALYQTGTFPEEERWAVRWVAPIHSYRIVKRRELIPEEPTHPRAEDLYYRISLGLLRPLPRPIPSRRLRRITFIPTTFGRLLAAEEINDLWIKSTAQERLWAALKNMQLDAERQYPLDEGRPNDTVDFALFGPNSCAGLVVTDEPEDPGKLRETSTFGYWPETAGWTTITVTCQELAADPTGWAAKLARLAGR